MSHHETRSGFWCFLTSSDLLCHAMKRILRPMYIQQMCDNSYKFSDPIKVNLHLSWCKVNSDAQMAQPHWLHARYQVECKSPVLHGPKIKGTEDVQNSDKLMEQMCINRTSPRRLWMFMVFFLQALRQSVTLSCYAATGPNRTSICCLSEIAEISANHVS